MTIFDSSGIEAFVTENNPKYANWIIKQLKALMNPMTHTTLLMVQCRPTLVDFFKKHPVINPKTFLGDAEFDIVALYKDLLTGDTFGKVRHFQKAYIPLNPKSGLENPDYSVNTNRIPCCPHDETLPMKYEDTSKLRSGVTRYKFVCPKIKWEKNPDTANTQESVIVII